MRIYLSKVIRLGVIIICGWLITILLLRTNKPSTKKVVQSHPVIVEDAEVSKPNYHKGGVNGTFYTYITDLDNIETLLRTVKSVEMNFNTKFGYDWVFSYYDIKSDGFPKELEERLQHMITGDVYIEVISPKNPYFGLPPGIDIDYLATKGVTASHYGLVPNHKYISFKLKNRFASYGFQFLPSLSMYKYLFNVELGSTVRCDINKDLFKYVEDNNLVYAFSLAPVESLMGTRSLYPSFEQYMGTAAGVVTRNDTLIDFIQDLNDPLTYTFCNMESNLAIIDLDILRTEQYKEFFDHMDMEFGLFYERWTDYNLKTLYLSTYFAKNRIGWLRSIGYLDLQNRNTCPIDFDIRMNQGCTCDPRRDQAFTQYSCIRRYLDITKGDLPKSVNPKANTKLRYKRVPVKGQMFEFQYARLEGEYRSTFLKKPQEDED